MTVTFLIFCEGNYHYNFSIKLYVTLMHYFIHFLHHHEPTSLGNPTQCTTCDYPSFILHIGTSIEVESYVFKLKIFLNKPNT
jgi:hypothetical protein